MFYLILAIILALFYWFAAPRSIKGTMNVMIAVFILVGVGISLILGLTQLLGAPPEIWLALLLLLLGLWAMRDISQMNGR